MRRSVSLFVVAVVAALALTPAASAGGSLSLKLQKTKPMTTSAARSIASFAMSRSAISGASDSKTTSFGVKACRIVSGQGRCEVDLSVVSQRLQGTLTVTPGYGRVGGKMAIRSFVTKFEIVTTCSGGSCGSPKVLDVTGSVWHRWTAKDGEYDETRRTLRQKARPSP